MYYNIVSYIADLIFLGASLSSSKLQAGVATVWLLLLLLLVVVVVVVVVLLLLVLLLSFQVLLP